MLRPVARTLRPVAVTLCLVAAPAHAAGSISPTSTTGTLEPGEDLDETVTVTLPAADTGDSDSDSDGDGPPLNEQDDTVSTDGVLQDLIGDLGGGSWGSTVGASVDEDCMLDISFDPVEHTGVGAGDAVDFDETIGVPADISADDLDEDGVAHCTVTFDADGDVVGTQSIDITVDLDAPPTARCQDLVLSADPDTCLAYASVDDGSSDAEGDVSVSASPAGPWAPGTRTVTLTVTDEAAQTDTCTASVTVEDHTSPSLSTVSASLWPPNHKLRAVDVTSCDLVVVDACASSLSQADATLVGAWSDEPDDVRGGGDGHTTGDIAIVDASTVDLRAERQGRGNGRVYTLLWQATDDAGNVGEATCQVHVPHDRSGRTAIDDGEAPGTWVDAAE